MLLTLGLVALGVVVVGVIVAITMARRQEQEDEDHPPASVPSDFVAPVSSGGFAWRGVDETPEQFKERVARENAAAEAAAKKG